MLESNKDKFIEDVKVLLSGNIADKNTVDYLSFKIGRLFVQYLDQYLIDMGNAGRGYIMTPDELKAALSNNANDILKHLIGGVDNESERWFKRSLFRSIL